MLPRVEVAERAGLLAVSALLAAALTALPEPIADTMMIASSLCRYYYYRQSFL